ncbi:MAG: hypothetical protein ACRCYE_02450 [Sarcina sp.]
MEHSSNLIKLNELALVKLNDVDDKIFKILMLLECILNFDEYQSFDMLKVCKFTQTPIDSIDEFLDILIEADLLNRIETDSPFINLYKLNI